MRQRTALEIRHAEHGLTLVEVAVALAIAGLALVAIYGVVTSSMRSFGVTESLLETQQTARAVLEQITEESRWAKEVWGADWCRSALCPDGVVLHIPTSNPLHPGQEYWVTYRYFPARQEVVRCWAPNLTCLRRGAPWGGSTDVLASGISALTFTFLDRDGASATGPDQVARIRITVTATRRAASDARSRTLQTEVFLRNVAAPAAAGPGGPAAQPLAAGTPGSAAPLAGAPGVSPGPSPAPAAGQASPAPGGAALPGGQPAPPGGQPAPSPSPSPTSAGSQGEPAATGAATEPVPTPTLTPTPAPTQSPCPQCYPR